MSNEILIPHKFWMPKCASNNEYNEKDIFCYACPFRYYCTSGNNEKRCDEYSQQMDKNTEIKTLPFQTGKNKCMVSYINTKIVICDDFGFRPAHGSTWKCYVRDIGNLYIAYPIKEVVEDDTPHDI